MNWMRLILKLQAMYGPLASKLAFRGLNIKLTHTIFTQKTNLDKEAQALPAPALQKFSIIWNKQLYTVEEFCPCRICCGRSKLCQTINEAPLGELTAEPISPGSINTQVQSLKPWIDPVLSP